MRAQRLALAALLSAACGSSRPADSTSAADRELAPDAGVSLGRPSEPRDGGPELPPTVVKSDVLEAQRISGDRLIPPDADDHPTGSVAVKFCVDASGHVSTVTLLRSSESSRYNDKIVRTIKTWTYRPIIIEDQSVETCTVMVFVDRRSAAPPPAAP